MMNYTQPVYFNQIPLSNSTHILRQPAQVPIASSINPMPTSGLSISTPMVPMVSTPPVMGGQPLSTSYSSANNLGAPPAYDYNNFGRGILDDFRPNTNYDLNEYPGWNIKDSIVLAKERGVRPAKDANV